MYLVKKIRDFTIGSLAIGSIVLYGNYATAQEITNTKEKMPEITGDFNERHITSRDGKIEVISKIFEPGYDRSYTTVYYLKCNGVAEETSYSILVIPNKIRPIINDVILYLDKDRNGFVDAPGKITGNDLLQHDVINDAPECKN